MKAKDLPMSFFLDSDDYEINYDENDTVADAIFKYLFYSKDVIRLNNNKKISQDVTDHYLTKLNDQVAKGAPIDFFLTTFSPKFKYEQQTNFLIHPDISDLMTLVHLQTIAKKIRELYPYNFRFTIIYKGDIYKNIGFWTDEEIEKHFRYITKMNKIAEEITGVKNSIKILRWESFLGDHSDFFKDILYRKSQYYYQYWLKEKEPYFSDIESWKEHIGKFLHNRHNDAFFTDFFTKEACKQRALKLVFSGRRNAGYY